MAPGGASARGGDLVPQEFLLSRIGHLSRRLEELHQVEIRRAAEERRETWILVFALSVVLIFCFAAFFMSQMEVRDLRVGLERQIERRSSETVSSIEQTLDALQLDRVPKLPGALEKLMRESDHQQRARLDSVVDALRRQGEERETQVADRLRSLEERMDALLDLSRRVQERQRDALVSDDDAPASPASPATPSHAAASERTEPDRLIALEEKKP